MKIAYDLGRGCRDSRNGSQSFETRGGKADRARTAASVERSRMSRGNERKIEGKPARGTAAGSVRRPSLKIQRLTIALKNSASTEGERGKFAGCALTRYPSCASPAARSLYYLRASLSRGRLFSSGAYTTCSLSRVSIRMTRARRIQH